MKSLRLIPCALALLVGTLAYSQESVGDVLDIVRENSPALKVAGGTLEMEKLQNRAERLPENPEFEFENVWAEGPDDGFGREIRVRQGLDFATVSGMRGKMAASLDGLSELRYQAEVVEVMAQAKELCARSMPLRNMRAFWMTSIRRLCARVNWERRRCWTRARREFSFRR